MAEDVANYYYKRIHGAICEARAALYQLERLGLERGALPYFDAELAEVKRLGGIYWNDDPTAGNTKRDAPEGVSVPVRELKREVHSRK